MKYVIDCTPEQLDYIKNVCPGVATMGIASAIDSARPLSELCEEEAKQYENLHVAVGYESQIASKVLRSFGSKQ